MAPEGNAVNFNFTELLAYPSGDAINFDFGSLSSFTFIPALIIHEHLLDAVNCVFQCNVNNLEHAHSLDNILYEYIRVFYSDDVIHNQETESSVYYYPDYVLPIQTPSFVSCCWDKSNITEQKIDSCWNEHIITDIKKDICYDDANMLENNTKFCYDVMRQEDIKTDICYDELIEINNDAECCYKSKLHEKDIKVDVCIDDINIYDIAIESPYINWLQERDIKIDVCIDDADEVDISKMACFNVPEICDILHQSCFGRKYYERICIRKYEPPIGDFINFNIDLPLTLVGDQDHIDFYFDSLSYDLRCNQQEPSGWRDSDIEPPLTTVGRKVIFQEVYIVNNTVLISRLPDMLPIHATQINIQTDVNSWCWSFNLTTSHKASLDALIPATSNPTEIEVNINGWRWHFIVEEWEESRGFPNASYRVSGRSKSAYFAEPHAEKRNYTYNGVGDINVIALINNELSRGASTGWTIELPADMLSLQTAWNIPKEVYSYTDKTPIEVISEIAACIGCFIYTDPTLCKIYLKRKHPVKAWEIDTATTDLYMLESVVPSLSKKRTRKPFYDVVFCVSPKKNLMGKLKRNLYAGNKMANVVSNDYLTCQEAMTEAGKYILGETGEWKTISLSSQLMPTGQEPALILPTNIVELNETKYSIISKGFIQDIVVNASIKNDGVVVRQNFTMAIREGD
jgi:hypothetical protein